MQEKSPVNQDHSWVCRQSEGSLGEIVKIKPLTPDQVKQVIVDPVKAETVCPGGTIICSDCNTVFPQTNASPEPMNFVSLKSRLKRSSRT